MLPEGTVIKHIDIASREEVVDELEVENQEVSAIGVKEE